MKHRIIYMLISAFAVILWGGIRCEITFDTPDSFPVAVQTVSLSEDQITPSCQNEFYSLLYAACQNALTPSLHQSAAGGSSVLPLSRTSFSGRSITYENRTETIAYLPIYSSPLGIQRQCVDRWEARRRDEGYYVFSLRKIII